MLSSLGAAQTVALGNSPVSSTVGGGTTSSSSTSLSAAAAVSGRYTHSSEADLNADWIVTVSWSGLGTPTIGSGSYSFTLQDSTDAEADCQLSGGSITASGDDGDSSAGVSVAGVGYDSDNPAFTTDGASGSLTSITLVNVAGSLWVGSLTATSSALSAYASRHNPSGTGPQSSYGAGGAVTNAYGFTSSVSITVH